MSNESGSPKTSVLRIVGGGVFIFLMLVGAYQNLGRNPVGNATTIIAAAFFVFLGLSIMGVFRRSAEKK
jgi:hypothetical protein